MALSRRRVVIIGAGIAGLAAAWYLAELDPSAQITVVDGAAEVGGKLRRAEIAGTPADVGAEALLARRPEGVDLIDSVGLSDKLIAPLTLLAQVRAGGSNRPLPARTMLGIPGDLGALRSSGILSDSALNRVEGEPALPGLAPIDGDISVGALVRDRLGDEVVERLVDPLLGGVYAGRADALSLAATMPALAARLRRDGGSLVQAADATTTPTPAAGQAAGPVFVSLAGGLGQLPAALVARGRFTVRTGCTARAVRRTADGRFAIDCGPVPDSTELPADAVIVATPAVKAATLLRGVSAAAAVELAAIETASMAIVTLAFNGVEPPPGSGLLVAGSERFAVKAITLSSQKWPGSPADLTVLRASVGRAGEVADLQRDDDDLVALVRRDLAGLIGISAPPIDALVTRWGGGLPQYAVGHVDRVDRIRAAVGAVAGLAVCGASYDGLGIPACIASAKRAAQAIMAGWSTESVPAN